MNQFILGLIAVIGNRNLFILYFSAGVKSNSREVLRDRPPMGNCPYSSRYVEEQSRERWCRWHCPCVRCYKDPCSFQESSAPS